MSEPGQGMSVLITGASSGIGATTAAYLCRRGFRVFGTSRKARPEDPDDPIGWIRMDVCEDDSVRAGLEALAKRVSPIDALVCNAGFGIFGSVEEVSIEAARAQFETNFFGVLRVVQGVLPEMRAAGRGRIVLVGSLAGRAPIPFQSHYSATKAAIDALALSLHNEVRPFGVHVTLVEPGDINTPFNEAMDWSTSPEDSPYADRLRSCEAVIRESLPKAPPPEVVAEAIARALASPRPRIRHAVGAASTLVPIARRLLPDWLGLKIIRDHFGV